MLLIRAKGLSKGFGYSVQIFEKWERSWRAGRGSIDCYIAILDGKKKAVAVKVKKGLYALNDRIKDQCNSGKECEDLIWKTFPGLPLVMQRDNNARHQSRKGHISLNHKLFISQFEYWLKRDLPNASNHIRVTLSSIKKAHFKNIPDNI